MHNPNLLPSIHTFPQFLHNLSDPSQHFPEPILPQSPNINILPNSTTNMLKNILIIFKLSLEINNDWSKWFDLLFQKMY